MTGTTAEKRRAVLPEILREEAREGLAEQIREPGGRRDTPPFEGESRAVYYSMVRRNLQTETAEAVMTHCGQTVDARVLRMRKKTKC